jgi:hypothetical protein
MEEFGPDGIWIKDLIAFQEDKTDNIYIDDADD